MKIKALQFFSKIESLLFYVILFITLIPVITPQIFHTLDGGAHMYNSKLILELSKGNEFIKQFYSFNPLIVPNLTGHFALSILLLLFPANIALKIFLSLYYFFFSISFRKMIRSLNGDITISYFAFPIGVSFFLLLGFFNFIVGFIFFFYGISLLFNEKKNYRSKFFWIELFFWTNLIWFSHPVLYLAWLIVLAVFLIHYYYIKNKNLEKNLKIYSLISLLFIILLPTLLLSINYLTHFKSDDIKLYTTIGEKIDHLICFRTLILFNKIEEHLITTFIGICIISLLIIGFINIFREKNIIKIKKAIIWVIAGILILILYFILPNEMGRGGYITDRLNYIFFIFLLLIISNLKFNKLMILIFMGFVIFFHLKHIHYLYQPFKNISNQAYLIYKAGNQIEPNKTIIAINRSPEWFDGHITNYIGIEKAVFIQENYEASKGYFPLVFNFLQLAELNLGELTPYNSCIPIPNSIIKKAIAADYVLIVDTLNTNNECDKNIKESIQKYYKLISNYDCKEFSLYQLK